MAKVFNYFIHLMKKRFLPLLTLWIISFQCYSQGDLRLSLKVDPAITFNRFTSKTDTLAIDNLHDDIRLTFGLAADIGITESYFFSTGLLYSLRKVSFSATNEQAGVTDEEQYSLEYLELPLTLKLYTNDVGIDSKIYFQTGFTADFLVNWKGINKDDTRIEKFNFFDSSFYVGAGFDKQMGVTSAFFAGLFFQRGLINIAKDSPTFTLKNDLLGLDLGLRF